MGWLEFGERRCLSVLDGDISDQLQLTSVKIAQEEFYPWQRLSDLPPPERKTTECRLSPSVEVRGFGVAEETVVEVVDDVRGRKVRGERARQSQEEEKGLAVLTSVRLREMKVTFTVDC